MGAAGLPEHLAARLIEALPFLAIGYPNLIVAAGGAAAQALRDLLADDPWFSSGLSCLWNTIVAAPQPPVARFLVPVATACHFEPPTPQGGGGGRRRRD